MVVGDRTPELNFIVTQYGLHRFPSDEAQRLKPGLSWAALWPDSKSGPFTFSLRWRGLLSGKKSFLRG
jgi:hypothetical protein